ncbi:tRNA (guanosine(46)-N7)-methyltransferase TrmB [Buchnera aphidicola (Aphis helianthi)]|uniref:tRNA (guanine-N(7)-)-methyltransferase n=1 Tax=Buchnera aphidicola (Aphis helianthi) TaxID=2315802 RepID=A0A4D6XPG3_9GAMM|nr:tRNA (guanosine(46)-N7)-methyltransferase TrmB [Buchnera aphidicola]QCI17349.1 tRNA (guanosine(46)-N7)-methyltransferase TrmB [Buchnera aphidicola (Aphis helianthi)]
MKNNIITPKYKNGIFLRENQSFVSRKGRITKSQFKSIKEYWPFFGIDYQLTPLNFSSVFKYNYPVILDIGFGSGNSLVQTAINSYNRNFLGVEVYPPGIGSCLRLAYVANLENIKVIHYNAVEVIENMISNHTLSKIQIFFPDPWPKKRHHKRRMIQYVFLKKILKKLIFGGILHIVTDSKEYAYYILNIIKNINEYLNLSQTNTFVEDSISHVKTRFEKKAYVLGNKIFNLMFQSQF